MSEDKQIFLDLMPVSHETADKLEAYAALLKNWNKKFNLISESTVPAIWTRHFLDSAQLIKYINSTDNTVLADIGSGAGFPGMVLGILGVRQVYLIESIGKKADFLREVAERLCLKNVQIRQCRAESMKNFKADIVTARAVVALPALLGLAKNILKSDGMALFLKGKKADEELTESQKYWTFQCEKHPSLAADFKAGQDYEPGSVLAIRNLKCLKRALFNKPNSAKTKKV